VIAVSVEKGWQWKTVVVEEDRIREQSKAEADRQWKAVIVEDRIREQSNAEADRQRQ
jgi:hypothetical protein